MPSQPEVFAVVIADAREDHRKQRLHDVSFPAIGAGLLGHGSNRLPEHGLDLFIGQLIRLNLTHAAPPSTVDARRAALAELPSECTPADKHRTHVNFAPSTGHHRSERFRVHIPKHQPTTSATPTLPMTTT